MTDKRVKSILEELCEYKPVEDNLLIEYNAQQVIASAHNLLKKIRETYDKETADDLSKRLIRSIATGDEDKFNRKVRSLKENKKGNV